MIKQLAILQAHVWTLVPILILGFTDLAIAQQVRPEGPARGSFAVGYTYHYELDSSRVWTPFPSEEGETPSGRELRPIRIGVWYPAVGTDAEPMLYRTYVSPEVDDAYFKLLNRVMERYDMWSYSQMFNGDSTAVERLMSARTEAVLDAPPAPGPFPVVMYSAGWYSRSPDNTVLAEYLASHGFVVATVPQLGEGVVEFDFKVTFDRVETQIADLQFALDVLVHKPYVDAERIATAGFSIGGIVALLLQQRDSRVDAVIGLDGSFLRPDWVSLTTSAPEFAAERSRVPILAFYRGHERQRDGLTTEVLDALHFADRYLVTVQTATHGEFSNEPSIFAGIGYPWLRQDWNSIDEALAAHQAVMEYSRLFLTRIFGSRPAEQDWIVRPSVLESHMASLLVAERKPPASEPKGSW